MPDETEGHQDQRPPAPPAETKPAEDRDRRRRRRETKPAGSSDTPAAAGTPPKAAETPAGPPATYALVVPPASETWLDATDIATLEGQAKTLGWSNEQAQRALEMTAQQRQVESRAFRDQIEADPDYGGDHLAETETHANLVLDRRPAGRHATPATRFAICSPRPATAITPRS